MQCYRLISAPEEFLRKDGDYAINHAWTVENLNKEL